MERSGKTRLRRGFTIAEVLVVVAILAILLAFAAPAVIGSFVRMHLNSLDNSAAAIFAAAQNRMTAMVGNGEFEKFVTDANFEDNHKLPANPVDLSGFSTDPNSLNIPGNLRYLDSKDADDAELLKQLVPGGSIESKLADNRYIVEFNYKTGAVYAVWYSDENEFQNTATCAYGTFVDKDRSFDERLDRRPLIGYYGGSGIDYAKVGQMPVPQLELTNAEELRLKIKMPDVPAGGDGFGTGEIGLIVTVASSAESTRSVEIIKKSDNVYLDQGTTTSPGPVGIIVLDTLNTVSTGPVMGALSDNPCSKPFHEWVSGTGLIPGEDITVTVTTWYTNNDATYLSQSASVTCNSLYASVEKNTGLGSDTYTANIAYGRHLQNLDADTATGDTTASDIGGAVVPITAAEQIQEIDFDKDLSSASDYDPIYSWRNTYEGSTVDKFTSIYNTRLQSYDGHGLIIRHVDVKKCTHTPEPWGQGYTGLFTNSLHDFKNITLVDAKVSNSGFIGALVGHAQGTTIENCQVYLEDDPNDHTTARLQGASFIGGLVGRAYSNTTIKNSFAATVVHGTQAVGGLIGHVNGGTTNLTIENSYAACYLQSNDHTNGGIGGLIGKSESISTEGGITISNSYAAGIIEVPATTRGISGLIGYCDAITSQTIKINNVYAAVRYTGATPTGDIFYGAINQDYLTTDSEHIYYVPQPGIPFVTDSGTAVNSKKLSEMTDTDTAGDGIYLDNSGNNWYHLPAETTMPDEHNPTYATFPYHQTADTADLSTPYPYPQLLARDADGNVITVTDPVTGAITNQPMLHYGDWLEDEVIESNLCYFEEYQTAIDGATYGVWTADNAINTLRAGTPGDDDADNAAVADGYGLLVEKDALPASVADIEIMVNGITDPYHPAATGPAATTVFRDTATGKEYVLYEIEKLLDETDGVQMTGDYYREITVSDLGETDSYWFNPFYACEIFTTNPGANPLPKTGAAGGGDTTEHTGVIIRTARQLANMAHETGPDGLDNRQAQNRSYVQLLDIDYDLYTLAEFTTGTSATARQLPAVLSGSGSYTGNRYLIRNLYIGDGTATGGTGLFGSTQGAMTGIRLVNVSVESNKTPSSASEIVSVGALAGDFYGDQPITDCGVYVDQFAAATSVTDAYNTFKVTSNKSHVGGLIGWVNQPSGNALTNCFAAVKVKGTQRVGGLIGQLSLNGSNATLTNCYSGGHTTNGSYSLDTDSDANVTSSFTINSSPDAGGLIGLVSGAHTLTLAGINYSTCSVKISNHWATVTWGQLIGNVNSSKVTPASGATVYATGKAFDAAGNAAAPRDESAYMTAELIPAVAAAARDSWFTTAEYDSATLTEAYPYPSGLTVHHGDWPRRANLLYYEVYNSDPGNGVEEGSQWYGFYGTWYDASGARHDVNTLQAEYSAPGTFTTNLPLNSGYAIVTDQELNDGNTYSWSITTTKDGNERMESGVATVGAGSVRLDLRSSTDTELPNYAYTLPFAVLNQAPVNEYYRAIAIDGIATAFNPYFACEALNYPNDTATASLNATDGTATYTYTVQNYAVNAISSKDAFGITGGSNNVLIRTPWNFAGMVRCTRGDNTAATSRNNSRTWNYFQMLNLNFDGTTYQGGVYDGWGRNKHPVWGSTGTLADDLLRAGSKMTGAPYGNGTDPQTYWMSPARLTSGTYDGRKHTISNVYVGFTSSTDDGGKPLDNLNAAGLFGQLGGTGTAGQGTVKNLTLQNLNVQGAALADADKNTTAYAGGVVGSLNGGTLENITVKGAKITLKRVNNAATFPIGETEDTLVGGLVGYATDNATLKTCTGINLTVDAAATNGGGSARVGGFVGRLLGNNTVEDCGVYAEAGDGVDGGAAYGSAGDAYDHTGVLYHNVSDSRTDYTGGFAGDINGTTVTRCFAAVKVTGKKYVGGFAGQLRSATAEDCYSGGRVVTDTNGHYDYKDPDSSDNTANVTGTVAEAYVGGFAGQAGGTVMLQGICYTTCSVYARNNNIDKNRQYLGLFIGAKSSDGTVNVANGVHSNQVLYAGGYAFAADRAEDATVRRESDYPLLNGPSLRGATPAGSQDVEIYTYGIDSTRVTEFPYQTNLSAHHGDWREPVTYAGALYWEKETSGPGSSDTYNFALLATDSLGKPYTAGLPDHGHDETVVTDWGYGMFTEDAITVGGTVVADALTVTNSAGSVTDEDTDTANAVIAAFKEAFGSHFTDTDAITLWKRTDVPATIGTNKADDLRVAVTDTTGTTVNKTYALNRAFAAAMEDVSSTGAIPQLGTSPSKAYQIRSLGQLANINGANDVDFKQTHDMNNALVAGYTHIPLTLENGSSYDGDDYRILNLNFASTATNAGLFGELGNSSGGGTVNLNNIVLYNYETSPVKTIAATNAAGGLVGLVQTGATVTIDNCAVAGYTVNSNADTAGGLVGSVQGTLTVTDSQAVVDLRQNNAGSSGQGLGGLVGYAAGTETGIATSYAGGRVVDDTNNAVTAVQHYAGGLLGAIAGTTPPTVTIEHSYAYMTGTYSGIAPDGVTPTDSAYLITDVATQTGDYGQADSAALAAWVKEQEITSGSDTVPVFGTAEGRTYVPANVPADFVSGGGLTPNTGTQPDYPFGAIVTDKHQGGNCVHYGTWPVDNGFNLESSSLKDALALMAVFNNGTKVIWFAADNPDNPKATDTGNILMWDSDNKPIALSGTGVTLPAANTVHDIALIAKGANFTIDSAGTVTVSNAGGDNVGTLTAYKGGTDVLKLSDKPNEVIGSTINIALPDTLVDYAVCWLNITATDFEYGTTLFTFKNQDNDEIGNFKLETNGIGVTTGDPPVESGPEIFDDTLYCTCTEKCTDGSVKDACPLCHSDYTQCQAAEPTTPESASLTPEPTVMPEPTATPEPTPEPATTPEPTVTPEPTAAPEPTPEPETSVGGGVPDAPQESPAPTPEATQAPEPTPEPTPSPEPTPEVQPSMPEGPSI